jgi:hypothetical protein
VLLSHSRVWVLSDAICPADARKPLSGAAYQTLTHSTHDVQIFALHVYPSRNQTQTPRNHNIMAKKGAAGGGEGSKKAQGQARKADAAASKQAAKNQQAEKAEAEEWNKGAKSNAKAYAEFPPLSMQ